MLNTLANYAMNAPLKVVVLWMTAYLVNMGADATGLDWNRNKKDMEIPVITNKIYEWTEFRLVICPQTQLTIKSILDQMNASINRDSLFVMDLASGTDAAFMNYATLAIMDYVASRF